jgi:flagellin
LASGNLGDAQTVLQSAISDVNTVRGNIGAYQLYTVESCINSNRVALENLQAARSSIVDTDFATEISKLVRYQILVKGGVQALQRLNNQAGKSLDVLC